MILAVSAAVFAVALLVNATTIGDNVTVTSALTVNGNTTLGNAATDTITMTGVFTGFVSNASSTVSAGVFNVGGSLGVGSSTPAQELGVTGDAYISSTLTVEGASRIYGLGTLSGGYVSQASSTVSAGVFNVGSGSLGVASSTPSQEVGIVGDVYIDTTLGVATSTASQELGIRGSALFEEQTGTTTIGLNSNGTGVGSCIQLRGTNATMWRIYAGATTTATGNLRVEQGSCL